MKRERNRNMLTVLARWAESCACCLGSLHPHRRVLAWLRILLGLIAVGLPAAWRCRPASTSWAAATTSCCPALDWAACAVRS